MNYLLITKCESCLAKGVCANRKVFENAISIVNKITSENYRDLGGSFVLNCNNYLEQKVN